MVMMERVTLSKGRIAHWHRLPHPAQCEKEGVWAALQACLWQGLFKPPRSERVGGLFLSLDEMWAALPTLGKLCDELHEWGINDATLSEQKQKECWVHFHSVKFGKAPPEVWPELRRSLLEFEPMLAALQHDVGLWVTIRLTHVYQKTRV